MNTAAAFDARPSTVRIPPLRQRARTVVRSLGTLARDPGRLDQVLVLAEAVNAEAIGRALEHLREDPEGRALLAEQPRIDRDHIDFEALRRLPEGTLGREYARFLDDNGITPDVFAKLPDVGDPRAEYVMLRMRQTHDLWHVLTGYLPDVRGEILLQAFTYGQTRAPSSLLLALFGTVRWPLRWPGHVQALRTAFQRGKTAAFLPLFRWEEHWSTPVSDLRARLACPSLMT
jgi:ubiquinone biosynthesis protein COQ4